MSDPYVKPTDLNQLLHDSSFQPSGVFKSILRSQFTRVKRIVRDETLLKERLNELGSKLETRGYLSTVLKKE